MYGPGAGEKGVLDCPALLQFAMREAEAGQHCAASGCSCGWRGRGDILIPSWPATWRWCWCGVSRVIRGTVGLHFRATNSSGCPGPGSYTISHPTTISSLANSIVGCRWDANIQILHGIGRRKGSNNSGGTRR